ncbi:hypothetical protein M041_gp57 [Mycobacterium phage Severus]|uniref:hypothetical protein n=1 Tax=Mycobacterium phage Severus TaxID=1327776 RepID=UPI00032B2DDE|nr:hypothetical protein M041_gp57 [Mycobacterium phage Severus]AVO22431.1 hypothetical protein SEA_KITTENMITTENS_30 [Mycobacterium phage KittenMittens]QWS69314.1 hypothetical protein SEA_PEACEMEAL1_30 [Mycobacterium Phage PeaceMeal1]QZD97014.1 hypothetical protein SEA_DRAKE94_30 [Mycobacterium phage Drake94]USL89164.1 hypothetical protein SEA_POOMPHA_30 [Mycobacterium phage Poompha]AGK87962.1 hypothetical protein PBI_SEVERUS_30 [Mycobacterium phage Severus]
MPPEILAHLPQNWVGLFAVITFVVYIGLQIVEKYETIAKILPGGTWWHQRQKAKGNRRTDLVAEDNEVIRALQEQVTSIVGELATVRETLRSFTAWSVYDARWHHQALVTAAIGNCVLPDHLDYFAFEKLWRDDPLVASRLP